MARTYTFRRMHAHTLQPPTPRSKIEPIEPARRQALQRMAAVCAGAGMAGCGGGGGGGIEPAEVAEPLAAGRLPLPSFPPKTKPVWLGSWAQSQSVNARSGTATSLIGTVDIPSVFSVASGDVLPAGVALTALSAVQVRIDFGAIVPVGSYSFAIEATAK